MKEFLSVLLFLATLGAAFAYVRHQRHRDLARIENAARGLGWYRIRIERRWLFVSGFIQYGDYESAKVFRVTYSDGSGCGHQAVIRTTPWGGLHRMVGKRWHPICE